MHTLLKILLIITLVIVAIIIGAILFFSSYAKLNTVELQPNEVVLKGGTKKALVLYQKSKHTTATDITMALAKELNAEGYTVVINHPSSKLTYHTDDFDVFAFGSAVYMGTVSKPLQTYMEKTSFRGKKVMVYAVGDNTTEKAEVNLLKGKVKDADKVEGIKVKKGQEDKIQSFVKEFLK